MEVPRPERHRRYTYRASIASQKYAAGCTPTVLLGASSCTVHMDGTYLRCKSSDAVFVAGPHPAVTAGTTDGRPREGRNTIEQRQARVMWGGSRGKWGLIPHCQRADARAHIPARVRPSSCRKEKKIPTRGILDPPPVHHQGEDLNTSGHIRCYRYREMLIREDHLCDNAASG